jgi:transposase-like protein
MENISNFEQNITNLSLETLSNLLKIISKQIIELGGKPNEIIKIDVSLVDLEKQRWANGVICPWCNNEKGCWKNGLSKKNKAIQRYKCKKCMKTFDFMTGTFLSYSHLTMDQLTKLIQCIVLKLTCKKTGEICSFSLVNAWRQRIKILEVFDKTMESELLNGAIWLDETYTPQNYKGNWNDDNKAKKLQEKEDFFKNNTLKLRGLSRFQTCILTGIDENNNIFFEINGFGKMHKEESLEKLKQNVKNPTIIFSDKEETYKSFSEINNTTHISIKSDNKKDKSLQKINSLHSRLKSFLRPFNGVSNIYLKLYLKWFHFLEKIKQDNNEHQTHKVWNLLLSYTLHAIF